MKEVDKQFTGLGDLQYEYTDAKASYEVPAKTKKNIFISAYMLVVAAGLLVWFLYSIVTHSLQNGFGETFLAHLPYLFLLIVVELIFILTALSKWRSFVSFAFRRNLVHRRRGRGRARVNQLKAEFEEAEENKFKENALRIYTSYIEVVCEGAITLLDREKVGTVSAKPSPNGSTLQLQFSAESGEEQLAISVPYADVVELRSIFKEKLVEQEVNKAEPPPAAMLFIIFGVVILIGVALIVLHFTVLNDMPLVFGLFFAFIGIIFVLTQFDRFPVIRHGVIPLLAGCVLAFTLIDLISLLFTIQGIELTFANFFATFNYNVAFVIFLAFTPILIISGIIGIVKSIIFRK